jgi:hypothetical protein
MMVKEAINWLLEGIENKPGAPESTTIRFVLLEDGRLVPVEPGGMVEIALNELGAKIVEAETPSGEMENQST